MTRLERIKEILSDMFDGDILSLWNDRCTANKDYTSYIYPTSELDEIANYGTDKPLSELVTDISIDFAEYDDRDEYYNCDAYGHYCSFNDYENDSNSPFDIDELAEAIDEEKVDVSNYSEFDWMLDEDEETDD